MPAYHEAAGFTAAGSVTGGKAVGPGLLCGKTGLFFLTGYALRFCLFSG